MHAAGAWQSRCVVLTCAASQNERSPDCAPAHMCMHLLVWKRLSRGHSRFPKGRSAMAQARAGLPDDCAFVCVFHMTMSTESLRTCRLPFCLNHTLPMQSYTNSLFICQSRASRMMCTESLRTCRLPLLHESDSPDAKQH